MKILRYIDFLAPAQELSLTSEIGPTLGQLKIKAKPFCDKFNEQTKNLKEGLLLKVRIIIYTNLTLDFLVTGVPITFLLYYISNNNKISIKDVYKIYLIKTSFENNLKTFYTFKNIISICNHLKLKIIYEN